MLKMYRIVRQFLHKVESDYVNAFSGQAALFLIISIFPMIMMLLNSIQFLPITKTQFQTLAVKVIPDSFIPLFISITEDLYKKSSGTLLSVSAIATVWSASRGALSIISGLNSVYDIDESRNYLVLKIMSCLYTIGFVVIIILSLMLLVFGNKLYLFIITRYTFLETIANIFISARAMFALCTLTLFFALIYKVLPNHKAPFFQQLPGALFSAAGWMLFSFFFSIYIDNFGNYSYMYGSLTTIILLMLWLYVCMYILFLGGEINMFFQPCISHFMLKLKHKKENPSI